MSSSNKDDVPPPPPATEATKASQGDSPQLSKSQKKRQKAKSKKSAATEQTGEVAQEETATTDETPTPGNEVQERLEMLRLLKQMGFAGERKPRKKQPDPNDPHQFWDTQPVPKLSESTAVVEEDGPIDEQLTPADVRQEPYNMPVGFEWCDVDVNDDAQAKEVYELLNANYVEDDDNMFRFDYSIAFLRWALQPPGFLMSLHVGVRNQRNGKLMAFISGIPANVRVYANVKEMVEINFLCVHKKLRSKRLAPVLIKEITRRVNLSDRWQAVYTAGVVLPKPVTSARYYHRSLDPKKLIEVGFSQLAPRMTMARTIKHYKLEDALETEGLVPMEAQDVAGAHKLFTEYLAQYKLQHAMDEAEFAHWLLPRDNVIYSYVVRAADGTVTDMCSFYNLPSSIIGNAKHKTLKAAYSFYNVARTVPLTQIMRDALLLAKRNSFDVFNALNIMENDQFMSELKFGVGDGNLQYYLYNWKCQEMTPKEMGLVLL